MIAVPASRSEIADTLVALGEPFAAGFMRNPTATMVERFAEGLHTWARHLALTPYRGELLYPSGSRIWNRDGMAVGWYYVSATALDRGVFDRKYVEADETGRAALDELEQGWTSHRFPGGYTHSIPHYERVLAEGLDGFADRVADGLSRSTGNAERTGFYHAMETTLDTARILHRRIVDEIEQFDPPDAESAKNRAALLAAFTRVPFAPADGFFDALVSTNFIYYFDGPDNLGRFDQYLRPFFERSISRGEIDHDRTVELIRAEWRNVDTASAWNVAIGGVSPYDGADLSSNLTVACIEAARGMRRPNLALRLGPTTPDAVWDAALDTIASGCGLPALYWDPNYYAAMDVSGVPLPLEDRGEYAFGGCTELMVQGRSFVGSLDDSLNVPAVLERTVSRTLPTTPTFDAFYSEYRADLVQAIDEIADRVNRWQAEKAEWQPQPIRSLLIDDCIDRGVEYSAGGARYNWSVINVMGLANAIDSLAAIRSVVFENGIASGQEVADALASDFAETEELRLQLEHAPRYGNGDVETDNLAASLSEFIFTEMLKRRTWRINANGEGGPFVPSCLMFTTYAHFGRQVGATPDGRRAKEPIADSAGPYQGRDRSGPTAMLRSVTHLDQQHAPGTLVVNIRLGKSHLIGAEQRAKTRALLQTYFDMGGLQLQVNVIDQELLRDAVAHPERYADLIVRVGGYSEYWSNLEPALRESVLLRTEH